MALNIRRYVASDLEAMARIWLDASRIGHPFLGEEILAEQLKLVRDMYLPQAETWVAHDGMEPVGFIGLLESHVGGLFVDPARHGRGDGRALVEHAAELKGELSVDVYALNTKALGFYGKLGFFEQSRRPNDDEGRPFELVRMIRTPAGET